jgi:hypothetical protein
MTRSFPSFGVVLVVACLLSSCSPSQEQRDGSQDASDVSEADTNHDDGGIDAVLLIVQPDTPLYEGDQAPLIANLVGPHGEVERLEAAVEWSVEDPSVLELHRDAGMMRAVSAGSTTLGATYSGLHDAVEVVVQELHEPSLEILTDDDEEFVILAFPRQRRSLEVVAKNEHGEVVDEPHVTWHSSDTDVIRLAGSQMRPLSVGEAVVTARWGDTSDSVEVRVRRVSEIEIVPHTREMFVGDSLQLELQYSSDDGLTLEPPDPVVIWSSDAAQTVAIEDDGRLDALRGGSAVITAESEGEFAQATFYVDVRYTDIACFERHCCMLSTDHETYCWGRNSVGQLGLGDTRDRDFPHFVSTPVDFHKITAGRVGTCALDVDGKAWCWGANGGGRFCRDEMAANNYFTTPQAVDTDERFEDLIIHHQGTYLLNSSGELFACGLWPPKHYPPGPDDNDVTFYSKPSLVDAGPWDGIADVKPGVLCLYKGGSVECIGSNVDSELGQGRLAPAEFDYFVTWGEAAGVRHVVGGSQTVICGLDDFGLVWCAHHTNSLGILGHPIQPDSGPHFYVPSRTEWSDAFEKLHRGRAFFCGERAGELWCWGANWGCQLGWDPHDDPGPLVESHSYLPVQINVPRVANVELVGNAGCMIDDKDGLLTCWGLNADPQGHPLVHQAVEGCNPDPVRVRAWERPGP